jgi:hypothetical protein
MFHRLIVTCLIVLIWSLRAWAQPPQYMIIPLPVGSLPQAIAPESLQVVGGLLVGTAPAQLQVAHLLYPEVRDLDPIAPDNSLAQGVAGDTTVGYVPVDGHLHAFRYMSATGLQDLGTLCPDCSTLANGINGVGTIVGYGTSPDLNHFLPLVWLAGGPPDPLPLPDGAGSGFAEAISGPGDITGRYEITPNGTSHCAFWPLEGGVIDCHDQGPFSQGLSINSHREVVGIILEPSQLGYHWTPSAGGSLLPPLPEDDFSAAFGINDAGVSVGRSYRFKEDVAAFDHLAGVRWDDSVPTDLNTLLVNGAGWQVTSTLGINEDGAIICLGSWTARPLAAAFPTQLFRKLLSVYH